MTPYPDALRTAYGPLAERLRSWGENDPDPDFFSGDVLFGVLIDCGKASEALAQLQANLIAAREERDAAFGWKETHRYCERQWQDERRTMLGKIALLQGENDAKRTIISQVEAERDSLRIRLQEAEREIERLGRGPSDPGSQASPEAPSDLRLSGVDPSRMHLAVGCCSSITPCEHQRRSPETLCDYCERGWQLARAAHVERIFGARANDERAQREDPKGLSPKDASVIGEAEAPSTPLPDTHPQTAGGKDGR
jgi:hypothetical protein